ncbi:hypothetical protein AB0L65_46230 [Nonomuraea sp. NPDC052116]|uniref:hypothetical protein n=1 Tax=Nonomuraea sp. NPDC052116 TaxID=3155665 RepID=UPI00342B059F
MTQGSPRPRRLTVFAEIAAVLALFIAIVGVVVAVLAYEHDKEVAASEAVPTPVVTVTQFTTDERVSPSRHTDAQPVLEDSTIVLIAGIVAMGLLYFIWAKLILLPDYILISLSLLFVLMVPTVAWFVTGSETWVVLSFSAAVVCGMWVFIKALSSDLKIP